MRVVKVVVFAHTPPPYHGQSYMVELMLEGLGGDFRNASPENPRRGWRVRPDRQDVSWPRAPRTEIHCYHVNARFSSKLEGIGRYQWKKLFILVRCIAEAWWCRFFHGATVLYYVPAPGKRSALLRDWMVMFGCRWIFRKLILHWHAAGLGRWLLGHHKPAVRLISQRALGNADLSIVLSRFNQDDIVSFQSRRVAVVNNGIPDPCPHFNPGVAARRAERLEMRRRGLQPGSADTTEGSAAAHSWVEVLYLAHCTEDKGIFDAIQGLLRANQLLAERRAALRFRLHAAGNFVSAREKERFEELLRQHPDELKYHGFVKGHTKKELLERSDLFCFPTYFGNENQPVNLIEAMAFGLPILTTRWRSLPELFPPDYQGLIEPRNPEALAHCLIDLSVRTDGTDFRQSYLRTFKADRHLDELAYQLQEASYPRLKRARPNPPETFHYRSRRPLRIIQVFNDYLQPGGEANSVARIATDLEGAGHEVHRFWRASHEWQSADSPPSWKQPFLLWHNPKVLAELESWHKKSPTDLWLLHNVLPVVSLGVYQLARRLGVPIIQWLHNYRPISPSGTLYAGATALDPADPRIYWKESAAGSWNGKILTALLSFYYWRLKRSRGFESVRAWVAVSDEVKRVFIRANWEPEKLHVVRHAWHFNRRPKLPEDEGFFLFLGRIVEVKGVRFLVDLWKNPRLAGRRLVIAGTGSLVAELSSHSPPTVEWVGHVEGEAKNRLVARCRALLFPALWAEPLSTVAYEGYEHFKPMLASATGGMVEAVVDGETGRLLPPGDYQAWLTAIDELARNPELAVRWGEQGNAWLQRHTSPDGWNEKFDAIAEQVLSPRPKV